MTVNEFAKEVHENAVAHGWWETARSFPEVAALIHSEVSEALEEWRDGNPAIYGCCGIPGAVCEFEGACDKEEKTGTCKPEGVAVELCDAIIRILDYLAYDSVTHTRTITKVKKLYDVSAVDIPAYNDTSISARSFFEEEHSRELAALEQARRRKKLVALTY